MFESYMIGTDFDGTVCRANAVTERDLEAIREFRAGGGIFGVVTGRCYAVAVDCITRYLHHEIDYLIIQNGSAGVLPNGEFLFSHGVDAHEVLRVLEYTNSHNISYVGCASGRTIINITGVTEDEDIAKILEFGEVNHLNCISSDNEDLPEHEKNLSLTVGDKFNIFRNGNTIDMPPKGVSKASGIYEIADKFKISPDNIYTVGDGLNDIPMIREFHGCAMEKSEDDVKKAAEITVTDIADVIEKIKERIKKNEC